MRLFEEWETTGGRDGGVARVAGQRRVSEGDGEGCVGREGVGRLVGLGVVDLILGLDVLCVVRFFLSV